MRKKVNMIFLIERSLFVWLIGFLMSSSANRLSCGRIPRLTFHNFKCCPTETELEDHGLCLSRSYHTDTNPTSRQQTRGLNHDLLTRGRVLYPLRFCAACIKRSSSLPCAILGPINIFLLMRVWGALSCRYLE